MLHFWHNVVWTLYSVTPSTFSAMKTLTKKASKVSIESSDCNLFNSAKKFAGWETLAKNAFHPAYFCCSKNLRHTAEDLAECNAIV